MMLILWNRTHVSGKRTSFRQPTPHIWVLTAFYDQAVHIYLKKPWSKTFLIRIPWDSQSCDSFYRFHRFVWFKFLLLEEPIPIWSFLSICWWNIDIATRGMCARLHVRQSMTDGGAHLFYFEASSIIMNLHQDTIIRWPDWYLNVLCLRVLRHIRQRLLTNAE